MRLIRRLGAGEIVIGVTLLVALAMGLDVSIWLRGGFGWRWPYEVVPLLRIVPLIVVSIIYVAGAIWFRRRRSSAPLILWAIAGSVALVAAGVATRSDDVIYEMFTRTASLLTTGQFYAAVHMDWAAGVGDWQHWTRLMGVFQGHMITSPPGAPIIYHAIIDLFDGLPTLAAGIKSWLLPYQCANYDLLQYSAGAWASTLFGMLMPLWVGLTTIPLYFAAKRFIGAGAREAVIWWPLLPGLIGFAGSWSTLYPLFGIAAFALLIEGLERKHGIIWLFLSGTLLSIGIWVNFTLIPLLLFIGLYTLGFTLVIQRRSFWRAALAGVWFGIGLIVPWLIFWAAGGETFFAIFATSMGFHFELNRSYWFWLYMHFWDWLLWTGAGFGLLLMVVLVRWRRTHEFGRITLLSLCLAVTIVIMVVSGTARGETGRVWLFFSPLLLIAAAGGLQLLPRPRANGLLVAQAIYMITLVAVIHATSTDLQPPPPAPQVATSQPADATFGEADHPLFRLIGWQGQADNGTLDLRLNWQGVSEAEIPYWFGVVLVDPNGQAISEKPWQPGGATRYPTTCWRPDQTVGDDVRIALPADAAPGDWWVSLSAYVGDQTDQRLQVTQTGQPPDQQIGLGPIHVGG